MLRLQYPYVTGSWLVEPFAFGGIGWSRLSLRDAPPALEDTDDVGVVPFGGGLRSATSASSSTRGSPTARASTRTSRSA